MVKNQGKVLAVIKVEPASKIDAGNRWEDAVARGESLAAFSSDESGGHYLGNTESGADLDGWLTSGGGESSSR